MQKAKTTWQAQNLIVDDNPSRSLCKPHFYTDEICGWMILCGSNGDALRVSSRSRRPGGAQEPNFHSSGWTCPAQHEHWGPGQPEPRWRQDACPVQALMTGPADLA